MPIVELGWKESIPSLATGAAMAKAAMETIVAMTAVNFILIIVFR
jgi:hypothetical protein